jgi:YegS/Rv2252/BmrU family lipid kinase
VLIVNAHSRKGAALFREAKRKLEDGGIRLIAAHAVRNPKLFPQTVRQAVSDDAPMIIVGGGDGSLSSAVDLLVGRDCVFALLPLGTANSLARTLGIPLDLDGAIDTIVNGALRRIDLGVIDGDYFANCAAIGLAPMIGSTVPHSFKKYLGRLGYLIWAGWCLARFKSFELTVEDGAGKHRLSAVEVRIANGRFHGGVEVVEDGSVDSGEIVVQAVTGRARTMLILNWLATMLRLPARRQTVTEFHARRLSVQTDPPLAISIDGEVTASTPARVEVAPAAIQVVVPRPSRGD